MNLKQFLIRKLMLFFTLSTLITVAVVILGEVFDPEARFGYEGFLSPLIYAGACVLPSLATWSKRELKPRELLLRELIQFLLTEAVVLGIAGSVLVIYLLVFLLSWLTNTAQARRVNEELLEFQRLHGVDPCVPDEAAAGNP